MKKIGEIVCKHNKLIIILCLFLLIPSLIGMYKTKINYDILVYLPEDIETIKGEKILTEDFHMGAFAIAIVENMPDKDILTLENEIRKLSGVSKVVSINDITGTTIPIEFLPSSITEKVAHDNSKLMLVTFNESTSDDLTLSAVQQMREIVDDNAKIGGMSAMVLDTKQLFNSEMALYVGIAVVLCILVLMFSLDSYLVPILLILNIGVAILFNMGTNIFLGDISYITKAISSVLQLGVTTDFSIFLYHKYEKAKKENKDKSKAMENAIHETLVSVFGSSLTTIAGFLALCTMNLTLGTDIGIVMAKGVVFGLLCVITVFPALLLIFDKQIEKTKHKEILPKFTKVKDFALNHYKVIFIIFLILLYPAYKAQTKTDVYYKLDESIPDTYGYSVATKALKEEYNIVSQEIILVNKDMPNSDINSMVQEIERIDGIDLVLNPASLTSLGISDDIISDDIKKIYESDKYKLILVNSEYDIATEELNEQITKVNEIVKSYDETAIVAGEGPLMKDLVEITDEDFKNVNTFSILVIFVLMLIVLKSLILPILLVCAIEFAIFINMGVPYFTGTEIPFIASVVIGTIQLGATIDYAILLTTKYLEQRKQGIPKKEAVRCALDNSINSIIVSGLCFFAATIGVGVVSKIDMIGTLCTLISRGAIISMIVVILIVPSLLMVFDKLICMTTLGFKNKERKKNMKTMKKNVKKMAMLGMVSILGLTSIPAKALTKDETVYSKLDENGNTKYTIVTEHLINDEKLDKIIDKTDLKDIINTNGSEEYTLDNNILTWNADKKDIYYKGTTEKELPVTVNVTYKFNGETSNVQDMLGKEGNVEITLTFENHDEHDVLVNGKWEKMYTPFVVATTTILDSETTSDLQVKNGKVVSNGKSYVVAGIATPGLDKSLGLNGLSSMNEIIISYNTTKFELNSIYSVVSAKLIDTNDLKIFDQMDSLYSKTNILKESSTKLVNGSKTLLNGTIELRKGVINAINELKNNNETLDESSISYIQNLVKEEALKKIEAEKDNIQNKAIEAVILIESQTNRIKQATDASVDANTDLINALKLASHEALKGQIGNDAYQACVNTNCEYLAGAENKAISEAKEKMYQNALELAKQTAAETAYNTALETAGLTSTETSSKVAISVSGQVKETVINKIVTSLNVLVGGLDSLVDGAENLSSGMEKFDREGINSITSLINKVQSAGEKLKVLTDLADSYKTFTEISENAESNSKFILVIDEQKIPQKKTVKQEKTKEKDSLGKKIVNLFK